MPSAKSLLMVAGLLLFAPAAALAQDVGCSQSLDDAEVAYFNGDFDRATSLLEPCLASANYSPAQGVRGYSLLGRIHYVFDEEEDAREAIMSLFAVDPTYTPNPQLPPNFSTFILEVKQQMIADGSFPELEQEVTEPETQLVTEVLPDIEDVEAKSARKRKALFVGGSAALAVAAILLGGNSGGGSEPKTDWPFPPSHPSQ